MTKLVCPLGFKVLGLKFKPESSAQHMVFVKQHAVREKHPEKPTDRTLFMLNVPPYCTEKSLIYAWRDCGTVKSVYFHSRPNAGIPSTNESAYFPTVQEVKGFKVAYVVFEKTEGLERALKWNDQEPLILSSSEAPLSCGVRKWCEDYNSKIPNVKEMQEDIDKYMAVYDKKVLLQLAKDKEAGEEDEDGWVTVTKRGRNPGFTRSENSNKKIRAQEDKKRSKKQLINFYSFQVREAKMKSEYDTISF
ncbi:Ribosomal RNA-processing protein 7-like protein A [Frankliniella fusca]|uniref:Ribosomal RNA-processing protein 7-like protein A n=1 Tax=Frankliniella fusca TaxID=407009 RepID=A0AAE1H5F1_9NEOP|nr:Ribosomal RNA-processing protein 7-like protein A [Frankliniella fusca]